MKLLASCKLVPNQARTPGNCGWCGKALPRTKAGKVHRGRRWCNLDCRRAYSVNHYWKDARKEAAKRDGHRCQECRVSPYDYPRPVFTDYKTIKGYHRAIDRWNRKRRAVRLEVHHIEPVNGRGYKESCLHHQANLRTLCHLCHREQHS